MMVKTYILVTVLLVIIVAFYSRNQIHEMLKRLFGARNLVADGCGWGSGDAYPHFRRGDTIPMLDGCYSCKFQNDCTMDCVRSSKEDNDCDDRPSGAVCSWAGTGLPKMMPREDVYKGECHICEFSVKGCEYMCWNDCQEQGAW